jgi:hypothetical protein
MTRTKTRRAATIGTLAVAAAAFSLTVAPSARAAADTLDTRTGCVGGYYTSGNYLTGYASSSNGHRCEAEIYQNAGSETGVVTTGSRVYTRSYYFGVGSSGTLLTDYVCIEDLTTEDYDCSPDFS